MRISDLKQRIELSFGVDWAPSFCKDIAISGLRSLTIEQALADGYEADEIWKAVCKQCPNETAPHQ